MVKRLVEATPALQINDVKDLKAGKYRMKLNSNEFYLYKLKDHIILVYSFQDESMEIICNITKTKVGYGFRNWLSCPACTRNTSKLYLFYGLFACRECHNLMYHSSSLQGNDLAYMRWQVRKLCNKLGIENILDYPIFKPKNMHQKTFDKLRTELEIKKYIYDNRWLELCSFYLGNR